MSAITETTAIKYAPAVTPIQGTINLIAIDLVWLDNPGAGLGGVSGSCHKTSAIYSNLSHGLMKLEVFAHRVEVHYNHNARNLREAEAEAKRKVPKPNNGHPNLYVIFNHNAQRFSHGSGDTAHLIGTLTRDVCHEVGHCRPFRLGHSGSYDSKGKLLAYSDGTSFMGKFPSIYLTASQLYFLGWLPVNKVALYDIGDEPQEFTIDKLNDDNTGDNVKAVYIPRVNARPIFLSYPIFKTGPLLALHLATGGGSQRVKAFSDHFSYENLLFQRLSNDEDSPIVRVSTT